jgi:hypothetical protein
VRGLFKRGHWISINNSKQFELIHMVHFHFGFIFLGGGCRGLFKRGHWIFNK